MEQEEYIVDGHRVTHRVHLGDKEIFLAVQQDAPLPFYVGYMEVSYELGLARFSGIEGTTEYTEAWELFIQRLQKQIEQVYAQRSEHHAPPQLLTEADCIQDSRAGDYEGKVLVMRPGVLRPEYWNAAHQLYFAVGGNGARASGHGTKVFCINMEHQMSFTKNAPDEEAVRLLRYYEGLALHYDARGYCVCTSEGKDSRVLGHLMRRAGVRHFYLHSITGIDPPELVYFQRANFQTYRDLGYLTYDVMYQYSMWQLMRIKKIPPLRKVRYCCEHLKERPVPQQGRAILSLGVRKYESVGRRKKRDELEIAPDKKRGDSIIMPFDNSEKRRIFETCYQDNQRRINPLAYWTDSDIWSYSRDVGLEQCGLYNEGFERLGCIGCPMARRVGREQELRRWPKFKAQYLRTFGHMLEDRHALALPVLEFASTPEQWFEWWLNDKAAEKADGNQLTLWGYAEGRAAQPARLLDDIAWELGVNISDLRLVPETKRQALDIMRHMRERERYPLHMWEEAVCYLTGAEVQFGDYGEIEAKDANKDRG